MSDLEKPVDNFRATNCHVCGKLFNGNDYSVKRHIALRDCPEESKKVWRDKIRGQMVEVNIQRLLRPEMGL